MAPLGPLTIIKYTAFCISVYYSALFFHLTSPWFKFLSFMIQHPLGFSFFLTLAQELCHLILGVSLTFFIDGCELVQLVAVLGKGLQGNTQTQGSAYRLTRRQWAILQVVVDLPNWLLLKPTLNQINLTKLMRSKMPQ